MGSLSGFFSRNWTLKLAAFGVALLLWIAVRAEAPGRQEFPDVPVQVEVSDPRWALVGDPSPSTVSVRLGGPSRELIGMAVARPSVVIPLDAVGNADTSIVINNAWVRVQDRPGIIVEGIEPASVRLSLEPVENRTLPAAARIEGELPAEFAMAGPLIVDPPGITVTGPLSRISGLDSIPLQPLVLSEVTSSGRVQVMVDTMALEGVSASVTSVELEVRVEDRIERVVSGIPIVFPPDLVDTEDLELLPSTASAIVRGARSLVDRADPTLFRLVVRIEVADLPTPGAEAEYPIALEGLPRLVQGEPQQSVVTVRRSVTEDSP